MSRSQQRRPEPVRSQRRTVAVWGCAIHRTKAGQVCGHCRNQGELFTRAQVPQRRGPH